MLCRLVALQLFYRRRQPRFPPPLPALKADKVIVCLCVCVYLCVCVCVCVCVVCWGHDRALKQLSIYDAPNLLCIQLKRFRLGVFGKVNKRIEFPMQLNLKVAGRASACVSVSVCLSVSLCLSVCVCLSVLYPFFIWLLQNFMTPGSPNAGALEYDLYGILIHLDLYNLTSFGHYVALILGSDGVWLVVRALDSHRRLVTQTHTHRHMNTYIQTHKHTHTHTHTHTLLFLSPSQATL